MPDPIRDYYASLVTATAGTRNAALLSAFGAVDRAAFVGPGPWQIYAPGGYIETPCASEAYLYQDNVVALSPERGINNGQPSLHARCLAALDPQAGDRVVHVGAGTGYYTAILAMLVGAGGHVDAYEIEADLAARAAANLSSLPQVSVHAQSALQPNLPAADIIYVNAGLTHPPALWLDALCPNGRLLFPLTTEAGFGVMLLVTRKDGSAWDARIVCAAAFIPCAGARNAAAAQALGRALSGGGHASVRSLRRDSAPDDTAWLVGEGWWPSKEGAVLGK
jgi:protein-L-isoaspartate(D-aspartate) O-methyltransferase